MLALISISIESGYFLFFWGIILNQVGAVGCFLLLLLCAVRKPNVVSLESVHACTFVRLYYTCCVGPFFHVGRGVTSPAQAWLFLQGRALLISVGLPTPREESLNIWCRSDSSCGRGTLLVRLGSTCSYEKRHHLPITGLLLNFNSFGNLKR